MPKQRGMRGGGSLAIERGEKRDQRQSVAPVERHRSMWSRSTSHTITTENLTSLNNTPQVGLIPDLECGLHHTG